MEYHPMILSHVVDLVIVLYSMSVIVHRTILVLIVLRYTVFPFFLMILGFVLEKEIVSLQTNVIAQKGILERIVNCLVVLVFKRIIVKFVMEWANALS